MTLRLFNFFFQSSYLLVFLFVLQALVAFITEHMHLFTRAE